METQSGPELKPLIMIHLVHDVESEIVHQIADADRNHDRLLRRHFPQRPPIEMIEVRMRHEHEIDLRQDETNRSRASSNA